MTCFECIGHLQVTVKCNEGFGVYRTCVMTVGDVICGLDCVACLVTVSLSLSSVFSFVLRR